MPSRIRSTPYFGDGFSSSWESTIGSVDYGQVHERSYVLPSVDEGDEDVVQSSSDVVTDSGRKTKRKRRSWITANVANCKYELVKNGIEACGMVLVKDDSVSASSSYLFWYDSVVPMERIQELQSYQHVNHFPSMGEICRKDYLARNMAKMHRAKPNDFNFTPKSWNMPSEYNLLLLYAKDAKKNKRKVLTFIQKPANGAMGNGIQLYRNVEKIQPTEHTIVQEYLDKPLLLDGYKIDLRLYALVTHCDPLKVFLYQDGLVRLSTEKYASPTESNVDQHYMHLTNYSVNKTNEKFERHSDFDRGSKRSIKSLLSHLRNAGYDTVTLWRSITDLVLKTLVVASPHVLHSYRMCRPGQPPHSDSVCFEILGFDIFLDRKLKPWLLEVNRAPSFGGDEKIDQEIKGGVIRDALRLVNIRAGDKRRNIASQKAEAQRRLFRPSQHRMPANYMSSSAQRKFVVNRRKEELKEKLTWVRKEAIREEHEDANSGGYKRIFPCHDKTMRERYTNLLSDAFQLFLQSRSAPFQKNIIDHYRLQKEDEILDLIEQCEAEEGIRPQQPKPLSSMPLLTPPSTRSGSRKKRDQGFSSDSSSNSDEDSSEDERRRIGDRGMKSSPEAERAAYLARHGSGKPRVNLTPPSRSTSRLGRQQSKDERSSSARRKVKSRDGRRVQQPAQGNGDPRQRSVSVQNVNKYTAALIDDSSPALPSSLSTYARSETSIKGVAPLRRSLNISSFGFGADDALAYGVSPRERDEMNTSRTLAALERTRIKFPGKTDEEADRIMDSILDDWKMHKPRVATYWFVKLDAVKRRKVVDIVRGNVRAVMERVWRTNDVDSIRLMRLFNRLFNRMHWSHGQGLWNCFTTSSNSWETIFSKSTDTVSENEMECCRRIVRLCKDCLLIVYQFANDARTHGTSSREVGSKSSPDTGTRSLGPTGVLTSPRATNLALEDLPRRFSRGLAASSLARHQPNVTSQSHQRRPVTFSSSRQRSDFR
uniref:Tubulin polyglutamylase TTLL7-like n=1 Tax=Phallusia mammillata TaxID=59560 RepID=A0A6F9DWI1_9ASCI|nr:tubulin polyglutamylase TTLL7-like [Phallusia mammillata]